MHFKIRVINNSQRKPEVHEEFSVKSDPPQAIIEYACEADTVEWDDVKFTLSGLANKIKHQLNSKREESADTRYQLEIDKAMESVEELLSTLNVLPKLLLQAKQDDMNKQLPDYRNLAKVLDSGNDDTDVENEE